MVRPAFLLAASLLAVAGGSARAGDPDQAIAEIRQLGGHVKVDEKQPGKPVVGIALSYSKVSDDWLARLSAFPELQTLDLGGTHIGDAGLAHLKQCSKLRALYLNLTGVTDAGLAELKELTELRELNLFRNAVTDKGVATLKALPHLETLNVVQTKVTDAGVRELQAALPKLKIVR